MARASKNPDTQSRVKRSTAKRSAKGKGRTAKKVQGATRNDAAIQVSKKTPSVWLNRLLILLGSGVVLLAATKAFITVQSIPVQRISVTGELEHTQATAVQDMVQLSLTGGFLRADFQQMRRQLEGLPWIYEANVRRKWPNALEIHVVEQLPIARWGAEGFLNHEGGVFRTSKNGNWDSLPLLQGPPGSADRLMDKYQRLLDILAPLNLSVRQLVVDERGQVEAVMTNGMRLVMGNEDFLERMHRFVTIYRSELAARQGDIERVDLRYETGVAVAFSETSQVAGL